MKFKPQILVVEDDPLSQDMLVRRLSSRGMRVATVSDGEACMTWLESNSPDLILLDVQIPKLTGLEVLERIRKTATRDALPVILVTALGESENIVKGLETGANDYVVKPINLPVLLARMQVCLRIKYDVSLLIEAERQRVTIQAIGESCHQLAQPMTAVSMTLESLIRHPPDDIAEIGASLKEVLKWTNEVADVIHRMQQVGTLRPVPFTERMDMFDATAAKPMPASESYKQEPKMARILLIEDNEFNRDMLSRRLTRAGHTIACATSGWRGLEMAIDERPDLILVDLRLPDLSGWDVAKKLKADPNMRRIPLIALTAHVMDGDREKALQAGCDEYETKPVELPRLLAKIAHLLESAGGTITPDSLGGTDSLPLC